MGKRKAYRAALVGATAMGLLVAGYGSAQGSAAEQPGKAAQHSKTEAGTYPGEFESTLRLSDGRRVHARLVEGKGLQERHQAAGATKWSAWQTLYKTAEDRCQGVKLAEVEGTVSLIADFGQYCYDGEPPTESLAGVGTGDLSDWDLKMTEDFDGWKDTSIADDGSRVLFIYDSDSGLFYLRWEQSEGFSEVHFPEE
ncbi:MAG: hypothetical protein ACRDP3_13735 [Streptomyces sp.]|uniref:hypothetical protein n=1 Tax=Streptomyces sp. TaxID=1931 RepID=UPI003D6B29C2